MIANVFFGGGGGMGMLRASVPGKEGRTQVLVNLTPSSQIVGSSLRTPGWLFSKNLAPCQANHKSLLLAF